MSEPKSVSDLTRELDARVLDESGWFPGGTEVVSAGAAGQGFGALDLRTPLVEMIRAEDEEEEDEMRLRVEGAILIIREAIGDGRRMPGLMEIGKTIALWAQDAGLEPWASMTQQAIADMTEIDCPHCGEVVQAAQTRAAVCAHHKRKVQGPKVRAGGRAVLTKGQKPGGLVAVYRKSAMGNSSRRMHDAHKRASVRLEVPA